MKKSASLLLMALLLLLPTGTQLLSGQDTVSYLHRPFQFTFLFPPLSTNGLDNVRTINDFSLNLFLGVSGGVEMCEVGGFLNIDRYYVNGVQLAGFGNTVGGDLTGLQVAGFYNITGKGATGFQGAGFMNVAGLKVTGFQGAGFMNVAGAGLKGAQAGGFMNVAGGPAEGFQGAGFMNVAGDVKGVQAAGFMNVAGNVEGAQLAGFINICDSIDGVPIAFINVVKHNGYWRFGVSVSEVQYATVFFKLGVPRLYNIYAFGKPAGPANRWMYGGGLGTRIDLQGNRMLNIEGTVHQELWIAETDAPRFLYTDRLNLYNSVKFLIGWEPGDFATIHIGPTFNLAVAHTGGDRGILEYHEIAPYTLIDWTRNNYNQTRVQFWAGFQASISF